MWGTFSDPTYISVGDPYVDPRPAKLKQSKGVRQFQTGPTGTALGKKTKFARLFAGEKFVDFYQARLPCRTFLPPFCRATLFVAQIDFHWKQRLLNQWLAR